VGILDTVLRRREPAAAYRTIDGGHPAPYPDMTDEQLYNYELAFNVPNKTFDRPPRSTGRANYATRSEPEPDPFEPTPIAPIPPVVHESRVSEQQSAWQNDMLERTPASSQSASQQAQPQQDPQSQTGTADLDNAEPPLWTEHEQVWTSRIPLDKGRPLDLTKPVRTITTRQPVEIITAKARHPVYKVHGYIGDDEIATVFTLDGRLSENGAQFLENVPEERELYLNIYPNSNSCSQDRYVITQHSTREEADAAAGDGRVACVRADLRL
jgi:hypothetical protein